MSHILRVGLVVDGPTDQRFLPPVVQRTYEALVFDCPGQIEVFDVETIEPTGDGFVAQVLDAAKQAYTKGFDVLVVHTDAEASTDQAAFDHKFTPAREALAAATENLCRIMVPLVTVRMVEAWMLADVDLLREEIGTHKSREALDLTRPPEAYADPKHQIEAAIRLAHAQRRRRQRDQVSIAELYQPIGQQIDLVRLRPLPSYVAFEQAARQSLVERGFLPEA
jgi:hypothetical protein